MEGQDQACTWQCSICLKEDLPISAKAVLEPCLHDSFCYACIDRWLRVKRSCPICKGNIDSFIYSIKSQAIYNRRQLHSAREATCGQQCPSHQTQSQAPSASNRPTEARPYTQRLQRLLQSHATRHRPQSSPSGRSIATTTQYPTHSPSSHRHPREPTNSQAAPSQTRDPTSPDGIPLPRAAPREASAAWRASIYRHKYWARPLSIDLIANAATAASTLHSRLPEWLTRELTALAGAPAAELLVPYVTSIISKYGLYESHSHVLLTGAIAQQPSNPVACLAPYLGARAKHFWHELRCFGLSPFAMKVYDQVVIYDKSRRGQPLVRAEDIRATCSSGSDSCRTTHHGQTNAAALPCKEGGPTEVQRPRAPTNGHNPFLQEPDQHSLPDQQVHGHIQTAQPTGTDDCERWRGQCSVVGQTSTRPRHSRLSQGTPLVGQSMGPKLTLESAALGKDELNLPCKQVFWQEHRKRRQSSGTGGRGNLGSSAGRYVSGRKDGRGEVEDRNIGDAVLPRAGGTRGGKTREAKPHARKPQAPALTAVEALDTYGRGQKAAGIGPRGCDAPGKQSRGATTKHGGCRRGNRRKRRKVGAGISLSAVSSGHDVDATCISDLCATTSGCVHCSESGGVMTGTRDGDKLVQQVRSQTRAGRYLAGINTPAKIQLTVSHSTQKRWPFPDCDSVVHQPFYPGHEVTEVNTSVPECRVVSTHHTQVSIAAASHHSPQDSPFDISEQQDQSSLLPPCGRVVAQLGKSQGPDCFPSEVKTETEFGNSQIAGGRESWPRELLALRKRCREQFRARRLAKAAPHEQQATL